MPIDSGRIWQTFRKGSLWLALSSFAGAVVFGVVDNLAGGLIPSISDAIRDRWSPPKYLIIFSAPVDVDLEKTTIEALPNEDARKIAIVGKTPHYVPLAGPPGEYWIKLTRTDNKSLPTRLTLKRGENIQVDTAEEKWERPEVVSRSVAEVQSRDSSKQGAAILRTRWITSPSDYDQIAFAKTTATRTMLVTALNEVGTGPSFENVGRARIYEYWGVIPFLRDMNKISLDNVGPWGGAFLTWVVVKSQVVPPDLAAAYNSWVGWAESASTADPEPGTVALFATKEVAGLRGNYLAGIVLRKLPECTELITGNIADRVVIACVALPIFALRKP